MSEPMATSSRRDVLRGGVETGDLEQLVDEAAEPANLGSQQVERLQRLGGKLLAPRLEH